MRPVFLEFPAQLAKDGVLGGSGDQFMLGGDLLVAPAPVGESPDPYGIRLPGVGWYDYWSGARLWSADLIETPRLERLPVFVRPGTILARQPLVQSTEQRPVGALQLSVYPGPDCRADLYFDDGVSFAYKRGVYLRQHIECQADAHGISIDFGPRQGHYSPWWRELRVDVYGVSQAPGRVSLGSTAMAAQFDKDNQVLHLRLPDIVTGARATIEFSP
jgi:alpha-glucosidase